MKIGLYVRPDGKMVQILGVGQEVGTKRKIAVYYVLGDVDKEGKLRYKANVVSKLKDLRPIQDGDYTGGSARAYYAGGNP